MRRAAAVLLLAAPVVCAACVEHAGSSKAPGSAGASVIASGSTPVTASGSTMPVTASGSTSVTASRPTTAAAGPSLARGINLGNALDAPTEGDWGVVLAAADFTAVKQAGFDHVRLPVRFNAHALGAAPYTVDRAFFERVDWAIAQALGQGLAIIVDFHHDEELMADPDANGERFLAIWRQIAERYADRPASVAFELCNEPNGALVASVWNKLLADALHIVRATNPTRAVVVEGVYWASAKNLRDTLIVPESDPNLVGSFHMYQPMLFTHQGAAWMPGEFQTHGVVFPGPPKAPVTLAPGAAAVEWVRHWFNRYEHEPAATNPSGVAVIDEQLDMAKTWADRTHRRVYLGEFGADDVADPVSRATWVRAVRTGAERRGFGWAYWDDGGAFRALDRATHEWVPTLRAALLD